jgi:putative transposase
MKPSRSLSPIGTYFVTTTTWQRRPLFRSEQFALLFLDTFYEYRKQSRYRVHQFVVMPEHVHLLITPSVGLTIERATQLVKGGFSHRVGKELGWKGEVWQRGFTDRRIRDEQEMRTFTDYILHNPVKRGLVYEPATYPYSSAFSGFDLDQWP